MRVADDPDAELAAVHVVAAQCDGAAGGRADVADEDGPLDAVLVPAVDGDGLLADETARHADTPALVGEPEPALASLTRREWRRRRSATLHCSSELQGATNSG